MGGNVKDCHNLVLMQVLGSVMSVHVVIVNREIRLIRTP